MGHSAATRVLLTPDHSTMVTQAETFPATNPALANRSLPTPVTPSDDGSKPWSMNQPQHHRRTSSQDSLQKTPPSGGQTSPRIGRKPVHTTILSPPAPEFRLQDTPASPVSISPPRLDIQEPASAAISSLAGMDLNGGSRESNGSLGSSGSGSGSGAGAFPPRTHSANPTVRHWGEERVVLHHRSFSASIHSEPIDEQEEDEEDGAGRTESEALRYHAFDDAPKKKAAATKRVSQATTHSTGSSGSGGGDAQRSPPTSQPLNSMSLGVPRTTIARPASAFTLGGDYRGRTLSPLSANGSDDGSPRVFARDLSSNRRSPSSRPISYVDLLNNIPYSQQVAPAPPLNNTSLQSHVGRGASLLDTKKTLEMYKANVKKTNDSAVQYEFAIFMINTAAETQPGDGIDAAELQTEAKHILQRLSDRAYPFAQYYLADGYFSGLFNKGKPDHHRAFPLFVAASKHGHAEASYRAALCYEFGWGTARSYEKAVQFYKTSASKNHPGAATRLGLASIRGDMGLGAGGNAARAYRDGVKWLKRAQESADHQYNAGPYELGRLHLTGDGRDIFRDPAYAAKLFTQSAELGHPEANFLMGRAYELGEYECPKDAALSVHFYNGAATRGHVEGMMALCAWYMVGAEPVLEKNEAEAYEWAKQAAQAGESPPSKNSIPSLFIDVLDLYADISSLFATRPRQSPVCARLLHGDGHRLPARPARGQRVVRARGRRRVREREAAARRDPGRGGGRTRPRRG